MLAKLRELVLDGLDLRHDGPEPDGEAPAEADRRPLPSRRATVESIATPAGIADAASVEDDEPEDDEPIAAEVIELDDVDLDDADIEGEQVMPTEIAKGAKGQMAIDLTAYGHGDWTLPPRDSRRGAT